MTKNPVADLVAEISARFIQENEKNLLLDGSEQWAIEELTDRILSALTPASAEPVAWRIRPYAGCSWMLLHYIPSLPHGWECEPLYAQPAPMTVEAEAKVLLERHAALISDGQYGQANTFRKTEIIEFLRDLSGEKS